MTSMVKQNACSEYTFGRFEIRNHSIAYWAIRILGALSYIAQCILVTLYIVGMAYLPGIIALFLGGMK